jgi:hypothetical protein
VGATMRSRVVPPRRPPSGGEVADRRSSRHDQSHSAARGRTRCR